MDRSHHFDMNFQFCLQGVPLESSEASALIDATRNGRKNPISIELTNLIDFGKVDSKRLFDLAVETNNKELASVAWKVSVEQRLTQTKFIRRDPVKLSVVSSPSKLNYVENLIETLVKSNTYSHAGAAMLLQAASQKEWVTIRETALLFANTMWDNKEVPRDSKFFRGFIPTREGLTTLDLGTGVSRKDTFHVSPIYIGLREGLLLCLREGLVEQRKVLSTGAVNKKGKPVPSNVSKMQRVYYKVKLTGRGQELCDKWGDMDLYISQQFSHQVAS